MTTDKLDTTPLLPASFINDPMCIKCSTKLHGAALLRTVSVSEPCELPCPVCGHLQNYQLEVKFVIRYWEGKGNKYV